MATRNIHSPARADFYVYVLFRENGVPFYIGKGTGRRWLKHEPAARAGKHGHRYNVIRKICATGMDVPKIKLHEGLSEAIAHEYEIALIAAIGREPYGPLVNLTDGGDGVSGHIVSPEVRARIATASRRRTVSPQTRAKIAIALRDPSPETRAKIAAAARNISAETRAKRAVALRGKTASPETRAKLAAAHRGKKASPETRAKMAAAARNISDETRAKLAAAHRGKKQSSQAVAKMVAAKIAYWAHRRQKAAAATGALMSENSNG